MVDQGSVAPCDPRARSLSGLVPRFVIPTVRETAFVGKVTSALGGGGWYGCTSFDRAVAADGATTLAESREQIIRNTRRFARRQMSWFRADPRVVWFDATQTRRAAAEIRAYYEREIARRMVGA